VVILDFIQSLQELGSVARNVHTQVALEQILSSADGHFRRHGHDGAHAPMDITFTVFVPSLESFRRVPSRAGIVPLYPQFAGERYRDRR
jgi:hypothetical protein